jgi:hypothetical protein
LKYYVPGISPGISQEYQEYMELIGLVTARSDGGTPLAMDFRIKLLRAMRYSPIVLSCLSLLLSCSYQLGRETAAIAHHLDAICGAAFLSALAGLVAGLYVLPKDPASRVVKYGTWLSLVALILNLFGLSL